MPTTYPGFLFTEVTEQAAAITAAKPADILIVCTRSTAGTALSNVPTQVSSLAELTSKIGTVPTVITAAFERLRAIASMAKIWIIPGLDPGGAPTQTQNLVAGLGAIARAATQPLSVVIVPEAALMATQADRTAVHSAAEAAVAANGFDFLHFGNLGSTVITKAAADTENAIYTSPQGNSAYWWGIEKDAQNRDVPLCVAAAAWAIASLQTLPGYYPPAGDRCRLLSVPSNMLPTLAEAESIMAAAGGYNFAWSTGGTFSLWNDATRSPDPGWNFISSRWGMSVVQQRLSEQLGGLQFAPSDPDVDASGLGATSRDLIGRTTTVLEAAKSEGAITDYRIESAPPVGGKTVITVRVKPIKSTRFLEIRLINTQTP